MKLLLLPLLWIISLDSLAQHSPNGRIDILNDQKQQEESSTKDLIFKTSKPLKPVIAGERYISGEELCEVEIATSYFQSDDSVEVEAQIDNYQCGASNGKYMVRVRTRDQAGEIHTQKFNEVWSRSDSEPVLANHVYSIRKDSELLSARIRMPSRDYCSCLDINKTTTSEPEEIQ